MLIEHQNANNTQVEEQSLPQVITVDGILQCEFAQKV
jgi:hypothetical protein